jgi:Cu-Zn family superoxide dismutase
MTSSSILLFALLSAFPLAAGAASPSAKATLQDADGKKVATATFASTKGGVRVTVVAEGLPPGRHGIHIHAAGKCEPPDFKTAGGHFNPAGKKHGLHNPEGAHAGDLPNLVVGKAGKARATFVAHGATLGEGPGSLFSEDGTALVVHADPDDGKTDPSGNSGARIACGVIEKP